MHQQHSPLLVLTAGTQGGTYPNQERNVCVVVHTGQGQSLNTAQRKWNVSPTTKKGNAVMGNHDWEHLFISYRLCSVCFTG